MAFSLSIQWSTVSWNPSPNETGKVRAKAFWLHMPPVWPVHTQGFLKCKRSNKTKPSLVSAFVTSPAFKNSTAFPFPAMKDLFLCRFVYLELPAAAKTPCTRFRWWQPVFSGEDYDQWAVDDIIILSEKQKQVIPVVNPTLPQVCLC